MLENTLNVSRETQDRLEALAALVQKWTRKINLISPQTVDDIWERHILDSAQLVDLAPGATHWVDLGSGGGFPGLVVAAMAVDDRGPQQTTLVESDIRKATFLRQAIRELTLPAQVKAMRIESLEPQEADVLSARALAPLDHLIGYAHRHLSQPGIALLPKGKNWETEDQKARNQWSYSCEAIRSKTNAEAAVLKIKDIVRV